MPANGPTRSAAPGSGGSLGNWMALHRLRRRRPPQTPSGIDAATLPAELVVVSTSSTGLDKLDWSRQARPAQVPTPAGRAQPRGSTPSSPRGPTTAPRIDPVEPPRVELVEAS